MAAFALCLIAGTVQAQSVESRIVWVEGAPQVEVSVDAPAMGDVKELETTLDLFDPQNAKVWTSPLKIPVTADKPWKLQTPLQNIKDPKKQHRVELVLRNTALKIDYTERLFFTDEAQTIQAFGVRALGIFPERKVSFTLQLNAIRGKELRKIPVALVVRDAEDNSVLDKQPTVQPAATVKLHHLDCTPVGLVTGPFSLEASLESEANGISFNTTQAFAHPNALVPVSGMEHGDPSMWYASDSQPQRYQTGQMYYSDHLRDLQLRDYPKVSYDLKEKHAGRESLRVDYQSGKEAYAWSLQELPGKPLALRLWVKGNNSPDQLIVHFEDHINFTFPAWQRNANFSQAVVCTLDFEGWRQFRVPVLGEGMHVSGSKGSTEKVDSPIKILALTVKPGALPAGAKPGDPRTVWVDDLSAETQAGGSGLLTLELQSSDPYGVLTADGVLYANVGNGFAEALSKGKLSVIARNADDQSVFTKTIDLPAEAEKFATAEIPLADLFKRKPRGPIEVDVTYADAGRPGARITRRITLKNPQQGGLVHDFEEPATFSSFQPGKVGESQSRIVAGGAEGSAHSLGVTVDPKKPDNSVLLHPALPGLVDHVEMWVKGGEKPVTLQVWFIDSGFTGVWLRPYNIFWATPITVDWQDWRKVVVPAPAIPERHGSKNRYFLFQPWYPLNLAFNAKVAEGVDQPVELQVDNIRIVTHLPEAEELKVEIDFPDDTRLHPPGAPLKLIASNFGAKPRTLKLNFELQSYQGFTAAEATREISIPAGAKHKEVLLPALAAGMYDLHVRDGDATLVKSPIMVLNAAEYFGPEPASFLSELFLLRQSLGFTNEMIYLDWDNTEGAPYLNHYFWFYSELNKRRETSAPTDLRLALKKQEQTRTAATQAETALKAAAEQVAIAAAPEQTVREKAAASMKVVEAAIAVTAEAAKKVETAKTKAAEAVEGVAKAKKAQVDGMAANDLAVKAAKESEVASVDLEKKAQDAEKLFKEADDKAKEAEKKAADLKVGDDAPEDDKKKAEEAKVAAEAARKLADGKKADAEKARALAKTGKEQFDTLTAKAKEAKDSLDKAIAAVPVAMKLMETTQAESVAATTELNAVKVKQAEAEKLATADKQMLEQRLKLLADAQGKQTTAKGVFDMAQADVSTATKAVDVLAARYPLTLMPVVGFAADWAGPEAQETLARGTYSRFIPNSLQVPNKLIDWNVFVRNLLREYKDRFTTWVFWENPDLDDAPQHIPPEKYPAMLKVFHRWVKLYSPNARVVAGGFNFNKALDYLERIPEPASLPFDEIAVQMNLGDLSPEQADVEGFLDELGDLLRLPETKRLVRITELDWGIGKYVSPVEQAAYHARAAMVLASRGATPHQFNLINTGFEFDGFGVFYRVNYGNSPDLQSFKPVHVPKPSYFALVAMQKFLKEWQHVATVSLSGGGPDENRAFLYRNADGQLTAAVWRTAEGVRTYRIPAEWKGVDARDVFGVPVNLAEGLRCSAVPFLLRLPDGYTLEQLVYDLRMLPAADGSDPVLLDLHLAEADSARRAGYQATGSTTPSAPRTGTIPGGEKVREAYIEGLETEQFRFTLSQPGQVLLKRRWHFDGEGQQLFVRLDDAPEQSWNLTKGQGNDAGVRESTFVLQNCRAGENRVTIRYERPGNCAGYRLEPLTGDHVPLERWGMLNTRQNKGQALLHVNAGGAALTIGKQAYADGIGAHATSFIEYPLDGRFDSFTVTAGIDGSTEGRGSVICRIFVDGKERLNSGPLNGFSKPKELRVDKLAGAQRLILSVMDAGDGNRHDLLNWVEGKLIFKKNAE